MENDERRCLIIDRHPMIRLGVRPPAGRSLRGRGGRRRPPGARDDDLARRLRRRDRRVRGPRPGLADERDEGDPRHCARRSRASGSSPTALASSATRPPRRCRPARPRTSPRARLRSRSSRRSTRPPTRRSSSTRRCASAPTATSTSPGVSARPSSSTPTAARPPRSASGSASPPRRCGPTSKAVLARLDARDRAHAIAIGLRSSLIE